MIQIAASLLSANPLKLDEEIHSLEGIVDRLHIDVMDGNFVPNLAFGVDTIKAIPTVWKKDLHLMVSHPHVISRWFEARDVDTIIFHPQAVKYPEKLIHELQNRKIHAGIALSPEVTITQINTLLPLVDFVLIMGIHPGFSGQQMLLDQTLEKIRFIHTKYPQAHIAVDGGVNVDNIRLLKEAGTTIVVSGKYLFSAPNRKEAAEALRK